MVDKPNKKTQAEWLTKKQAKTLINALKTIKHEQTKSLSARFGRQSGATIAKEGGTLRVPVQYLSNGQLLQETVEMRAVGNEDAASLINKVQTTIEKHTSEITQKFLITFQGPGGQDPRTGLEQQLELAASVFQQAAANSNAPATPEAAPETAEDKLSKIRTQLWNQQITAAEAEAQCRKILEEEPENIKAHIGLVNAFAHQNKFGGAFETLSAAQKLEPANPEIDLAFAELHMLASRNMAAQMASQEDIALQINMAEKMATIALQKSGGNDAMRASAIDFLQRLNHAQTQAQFPLQPITHITATPRP